MPRYTCPLLFWEYSCFALEEVGNHLWLFLRHKMLATFHDLCGHIKDGSVKSVPPMCLSLRAISHALASNSIIPSKIHHTPCRGEKFLGSCSVAGDIVSMLHQK